MAAGSYGTYVPDTRKNVQSLTIPFTTDASGNVTISDSEAQADGEPIIRGELQRVIVSSTDLSNLFDMTVLDVNGVDLLNGWGGNLMNTEPTPIDFEDRPLVLDERIRPQIENGGNAKSGSVIIYYMLG